MKKLTRKQIVMKMMRVKIKAKDGKEVWQLLKDRQIKGNEILDVENADYALQWGWIDEKLHKKLTNPAKKTKKAPKVEPEEIQVVEVEEVNGED